MTKPLLNYCRRWRFLLLLSALLALLVFQPIASAIGVMDWLFDALFVIVLATLIFVLAQDKVWRFIALILCVPAAALTVGSHFLATSAHGMTLSAGHSVGALFFLMVVIKIVRSIFASAELSLDSIFGAICGNMLLGVAWGLTYATIYAVGPESFEFGNAIRPNMELVDYSRNIFIYYSFVILTTVGYGDVTPASIPARTLSWVEAVTGQLYLAVLIAGLISAIVARKTARNC
jgi:hypothetical protein